MKTITETRRVGELLGPVDWSYNFRSHFDSMGHPDNVKDEYCNESKERLKLLEQDPTKYLATTDGGWPRCGWYKVVAIGMYDGWPYWSPTPSVCLAGPFGCEWHSFNLITGIREEKRNETRPS